MTLHRGRGLRGYLLAAAAGSLLTVAGGAHAQVRYPGAPAPGADLRRNLETLAQNPNSVQALTEAGRAALDMGDGAAALGFFTRANQIAPGNPRVKLGLAAANARAGRAQNAIFMFSQVQAMGIPVGEIAGERGLAYDLLGQSANAQQDYVTALRYREDPEIRRRLALSLAISGQREAALRVIADQVRRADRGGLRTRAFVLALSGDAAGATEAARVSMPPGAAQAIAPFFQRLTGLSAGQMASAAHLGRFPSVTGYRSAATTRPASDPGALAFAGGGAPTNVALASRLPVTMPASATSRGRAAATDVRTRTAPPRTLATASNSARPDRESRRTAERWDLAGRGPNRRAEPAPQRRLANPVTASPPPSVQIAAPALATPLQVPSSAPSQALATAIPAPAPAPTQSLATGIPVPVVSGPVVASQAPLLQPHPYEPLRLGAAGAGAPAGGSSPEPVLLAGGSFTRIPEAVAPAPSLDIAAAAPVLTTAAPTTAPSPPLLLADAAAVPASSSPADLAVLSTAAPATTPAAVPSGPTPAPSLLAVSTASTAVLRPAFSDVVAAISALPTEPESVSASAASAPATTAPSRGASRSATPPRASVAAARTSPAQRPARAPQQAHPTRIWVQLAGAARASLPGELNRLRRIAPELLRRRNGYAAPLGASNSRLLVGPFDTPAEARAFVNRLKDEDISSYAWTSDSGQEVERLPAGR